MDFITIGGVVFAVGAILLGQALEGGEASSLMQLTAGIIVVGGTIGATAVSIPSADLHSVIHGLKIALKQKKIDLPALIAQLVEFASVARRDGVLALEQRLGEIDDPFMQRALSFIVDGVDANVTRSALDAEIDATFEHDQVGAKIFEAAGGFAPTVGILGAVLGLIHVMNNLSDPSKLGPGIAVAFVATVYGVSLANLVLLPLATKVKRKAQMERDRKILIAEGLLGIQDGLNPRVLEEKLRASAGLGKAEEG